MTEYLKCPNCGQDYREKACIPNGFIYDCGSYYIGAVAREIKPACKEIAKLNKKLVCALGIIKDCDEGCHHPDYDDCYRTIKYGLEQLNGIA
jgi:hypothetical protein